MVSVCEQFSHSEVLRSAHLAPALEFKRGMAPTKNVNDKSVCTRVLHFYMKQVQETRM